MQTGRRPSLGEGDGREEEGDTSGEEQTEDRCPKPYGFPAVYRFFSLSSNSVSSRRFQHHYQKCKSKLQWETTLYLIECLLSRTNKQKEQRLVRMWRHETLVPL